MKELGLIFGASLWFIPCWAAAQSNVNLFTSIKPQSFVEVRHQSAGTDVVTISMLDPAYPVNELRDEINSLGKFLGSQPWGVTLWEDAAATGNTLKATFGVRGLMNPSSGALNIVPLIKMFAGVPPPFTIKGIDLLFFGVKPTTATLRRVRSTGFDLDSLTGGEPSGVEYRVLLRSQDPSKLILPSRNEVRDLKKVASEGNDGMLAVWLIAASIGVGALVYSLAIRRHERRSRRRLR